ncbi:MAG: ATP-dependent zinc metalloprotease FtsH [Holosporales bacterium]
MDNRLKYALLWICCFLGVFGLMRIMNPTQPNQQTEITIPYSQFLKDIQSSNITEVRVTGPHIVGTTKDGKQFLTIGIVDRHLAQEISNKDIKINFNMPEEGGHSIWFWILNFLPTLLFLLPFFFMYRNMQSGGNKAMGFGKSKAKLLENSKKVCFDDVAGVDEAKSELQEIVDFLKEPQKFQRLGGKIPRGVLLVGPPGTGKTLLARAIAGEADVPFFSISGSDFVEMFVGVGASRVRDMFEQAKKSSPCIIFIDEIDAVGRHRGAGLGGGNDEREQTLNQLLVEMDGFEENQGVIIVAATNRPDVLDKALLRPGRFDRQVTVPNPDRLGREQILKVHVKKVPLNSDVDINAIARGTPGFSGADLSNLVNEAALMAARTGKLNVSMKDFDAAKDKVMMGVERRTMVMTENEKRLTAYHEGGHALVALLIPEADPIHKATIIPMGRALGFVQSLPENDDVSESKKKILSDIKITMGGRVAEEIIFGEENVTTGAYSDIKSATRRARGMIRMVGLNSNLGFQNFEEDSYTGKRPYSEHTAMQIDKEVKDLLDACYIETKEMLSKNIDKLHIVANALLEFETLTGDEMKQLLDGQELSKPMYSKTPYKPVGFIPASE